MSFYLFHKEQRVKSQNLIAYYKFTKVTTNIHQLFQEHHILITKFIQDRFKMNVRNLKEMFEQKGTIKAKIQHNQPPIIIPKPSVVNDMPITQICEEKINAPQPKTTTKTTINKSFLQQLNKKLDNKNTNISPVRVGGLSYLQPRQAMTEPVKVQNELKIEDIITGIASKRQTSQTSKARYAINESNALASEQKSIFKDLGSIEVENNTVSFQELLVKAIKNMNLLPNQEQEVKKNNESRKTIISNKYEYGQEKLTRQQKLKRIDFVLKVVFAENQYEIIPSNNEQQSNKMSLVRVLESKKQPIIQNQQWKKPNSQILENNRTPVVASTASTIMPERMKSVSNPFLEELKKIQKKQTLTISNTKQIVINNTSQIKELKSETIEVIQKIDEQSLALRQKKKQKKLQNFDDL